MGLGRATSGSFIHTYLHNQTTNWLVRNYNTFGAHMSEGQTRTHKTHHDPDLGETTTFPLTVLFVHGHEAKTQMSFCLETPKIGTPTPLEANNFVCKPLIKVKSKAKL
jgi:hypothetical protein